MTKEFMANVLAIELIANERKRQTQKEGWTVNHDDQYFSDELAIAASHYAQPERVRDYSQLGDVPNDWPWAEEWWKPSHDNRLKELIKAGALIVAEIERIQREIKKQSNP